jgi:hypothetical protein
MTRASSRAVTLSVTVAPTRWPISEDTGTFSWYE